MTRTERAGMVPGRSSARLRRIMAGLVLVPLLGLAQQPRAQVAPAPASSPGAAKAVLTLRFTVHKQIRGALMVAIFASAEAYASGEHPVRALRLPVSGPVVTTSLGDLPPGRYAIKAFHDLTGSGRLTFNLFGVPLQPVAFSNNARAWTRAPGWSEAAFDLPAAGAVQQIAID